MNHCSRRRFLRAAGLASIPLLSGPGLFSPSYAQQVEKLRRKVKITDVKCMIVRGTWDWNLIKIETDSGLYGIGEAYWGWGVKDLIVNKMKGIIVGEDPLNVDKLYVKMLRDSAGAGAIGGATVTAASGIEIALWDLAGRILNTPACNLLGGRFRDQVRFYRTTQVPREHPQDPASWRELVRKTKAERWGWTAFKFQGDGIPRAFDPQNEQPGHDPYLRNLKTSDIRQIVKLMEAVREELGPDGEFAMDLHWHYDVRDAIELAKALKDVNPMWIEDPVPPENPETMAFVRRESPVPVCTGENLYGFAGFEKLIELQGCDGVHLDIPKSGGLLESKRISDFASSYGIWTAAHNPASPVGTIASAHAASSMRNFRIHELANWIDWWPELVVHEGPIWESGYLKIQDKPGYGIEINPDVARAHLAPGETWWGS
jgi:L-alanine-DL-glutamate epimerase-like enolase superfamily enzyme